MICDNISVNEKGHLAFAGQDTVELAQKYGFDTYVQPRLHNMAQGVRPGEQFEELLIGNYSLLKQADENNKLLLEQTRQLSLFDYNYDY